MPNPARTWAGIKASQSYVNESTIRYHFNDPLWVQFYYYVRGYLSGDWGISPTSQQPVLPQIEAFLPATIELTLVAIVLIIIFGITLGVVAAIKKDKWPDQLSRLSALAGVSSPPFLGAIIILLIFFFYLHWFPDGSRLDPGLSPPSGISFALFGAHVSLPPTGLYVFDSLVTGNWVDSCERDPPHNPARFCACSHLFRNHDQARAIRYASGTGGGLREDSEE